MVKALLVAQEQEIGTLLQDIDRTAATHAEALQALQDELTAESQRRVRDLELGTTTMQALQAKMEETSAHAAAVEAGTAEQLEAVKGEVTAEMREVLRGMEAEMEAVQKAAEVSPQGVEEGSGGNRSAGYLNDGPRAGHAVAACDPHGGPCRCQARPGRQ